MHYGYLSFLIPVFVCLLGQIEKAKQDDALSDLSNVLVELKGMAIDMGSEIERFVFSFYYEPFFFFYLLCHDID